MLGICFSKIQSSSSYDEYTTLITTNDLGSVQLFKLVSGKLDLKHQNVSSERGGEYWSSVAGLSQNWHMFITSKQNPNIPTFLDQEVSDYSSFAERTVSLLGLGLVWGFVRFHKGI